MKYLMKILTKEKEYSYILKALPHYKWDSLLGFDNGIEDLKNLDNLRKVTDNMIKLNFLDEFYSIVEKEANYVRIYKDYLLYLVYNIQFSSFLSISEFRKPSLVYLESYQNREGDYTKYDYVDKNFNYEDVIKEYER